MTWLTLLQLTISAGRQLYDRLSPKNAPLSDEVASEIQAGLDALQRAHDKAVTLEGLESLRTKAMW